MLCRCVVESLSDGPNTEGISVSSASSVSQDSNESQDSDSDNEKLNLIASSNTEGGCSG